MDVTLETLPDFARQFVADLPASTGTQAHVVGLKGDLGAGKTTFVQAVARELGVKEDVTSPTFVIAQSYATTHPVFKKLIHMDAYRLTPEESDTIGFGAALKDPSNLTLLEWPENLPRAAGLPKDAPILEFTTVDESTRKIEAKR